MHVIDDIIDTRGLFYDLLKENVLQIDEKNEKKYL